MLSLVKLSSRVCLSVLFGSVLSASLIVMTVVLAHPDVLYSARTVSGISNREVGGISRVLYVKQLSGVNGRFTASKHQYSSVTESDTNDLTRITDRLKPNTNHFSGVTDELKAHLRSVTDGLNGDANHLRKVTDEPKTDSDHLNGDANHLRKVTAKLKADYNHLSRVTDGLNADLDHLSSVHYANPDTNGITGVITDTTDNERSENSQDHSDIVNSVNTKISSTRISSDNAKELVKTKEDIIELQDHNQSAIELVRARLTKESDFMGDFNFTLPWNGGYSIKSFRNSQWFQSLLTFASRSDPNQPIITLCVDPTFKEALLNWLITVLVRQPHPPTNILLVTSKSSLCSFVEQHKLPVGCIQVSIYALVKEQIVKKLKTHQFNQLLVIRVSVMRILNHFGYHVMNLDADAILLRNVVPVLEGFGDSDVVGTFGGSRPKGLYRKWGVVLCFGAILFRSSKATEQLWKKMAGFHDIFDDQVLLNTALNALDISWTRLPVQCYNATNPSLPGHLNTAWVGHTPLGLKVTLLPQCVACRGEGCVPEMRESVYIWHHGGNRHKMGTMSQKAGQDGVWFLQEDWEEREGADGSDSGVEWLSSLALPP